CLSIRILPVSTFFPYTTLFRSVAIGLIVSLAIGRVIATQLWGVSAYDPWTLVCVPALLLITGIVACWLPARRAASVDPLVALRRSEEHTSELQSLAYLVCRLLL